MTAAGRSRTYSAHRQAPLMAYPRLELHRRMVVLRGGPPMPAAAVVHMLLLTTTGGRWLRSSLPSMRRLCKNLLGLHISTD